MTDENLTSGRMGNRAANICFGSFWLLFGSLLVGASLGACGTGTKRPTLVESAGGKGVWSVMIDDAASGAEVFVDGVRRSDDCRRNGTRLRCWFGGLAGWPHRIEVRAAGLPTLRCLVAGPKGDLHTARCCRGCRRIPPARPHRVHAARKGNASGLMKKTD